MLELLEVCYRRRSRERALALFETFLLSPQGRHGSRRCQQASPASESKAAICILHLNVYEWDKTFTSSPIAFQRQQKTAWTETPSTNSVDKHQCH